MLSKSVSKSLEMRCAIQPCSLKMLATEGREATLRLGGITSESVIIVRVDMDL